MNSKDYERVDIGKEQTIVEIKREELLKVLGTKELFATGYGDVGSSIFYALGISTMYALGAAPLCLLIGGLIFCLVVFSYRELATTYPQSGGAQLFARKALGEMASFLAGWALLADYILTVVISAYTAVSYMGAFYPKFKTDILIHISYTVLIIIFLAVTNFIGVKKSAMLNLSFAMIGLTIKFCLILLGIILFFSINNLVNLFTIGAISLEYKPTFDGFIHGLTVSMVAYTGIEAVSQLAGESKNESSIAKSMVFIMIVVIFLTFAISFLANSALTPFEIRDKWYQDAVFGFVTVICSKLKTLDTMPYLQYYIRLFADYFPYIVSALAVFVLIVAANAGVIGGSRLLYSMSQSLQLPHTFRRLHKKYKTPYLAILLVAVTSLIILIFAQRLEILGDLYVFGAMLAFFITQISLIVLRFRERNVYRPYKAPFNLKIGSIELPLSSFIGALGIGLVLIMIISERPYGRVFGFVWITIGLILYILFRRRANAPIIRAPIIEEIQYPDYKEPKIKNILMCVKGIEDQEMISVGCRLAKSFGAHLDAMYVIELPETIEIDEFENLYFKEMPYLQEIMRRIKAIGTENDILVNTLVYKSRSYATVVINIASRYDLVIVGNTFRKESSVSKTVEYLAKNLKVPLFIYSYKHDIPQQRTIVPLEIMKKIFKND